MVNLSTIEPESKSMIRRENAAEMRWWAREFKTDPGTLNRAVEVAGSNPAAVKTWLIDEKKRIEKQKALRQAAQRQEIETEKKQPAKQARTKKPTEQPKASAPQKPGAVQWNSLDKKPAETPENESLLHEPKDKSIINVDAPAEIRWWANKFSIEPERLLEIIIVVGERPEQVQTYLHKRAEWEAQTGHKRIKLEKYESSGRSQAEEDTESLSLFARLRKSLNKLVDAITGRGGPQIPDDETTIFVNDPENLQVWVERLDTDEQTLRAVVLTVGNKASTVRRYLMLRQAWNGSFGQALRDKREKQRKKPKYILPAPIRKKLLAFSRARQRFLDKTIRRLPIHRIPFIKNKWALRALGTAAAIVAFKFVTSGQPIEKLNDPSAILQQNGIEQASESDMRGAEDYMKQADQDRAALENGELPQHAQETVDRVKEQLNAAQKLQDARLKEAENIGK